MNTTAEKPVVFEGQSTPWGRADFARVLAPGIGSVSTPGHGGIKVCGKLNKLIPDYMRCEGGWYEEDCDWCIPYLVFGVEIAAGTAGDPEYGPHCAAVLASEQPKQTLCAWRPDAYAKFFNVPIETLRGKSYIYDNRCFENEHANDYVAIAAWGSSHETVPEGFVGVCATLGGKRSNREAEKFSLVPQADYDARTEHGYVMTGKEIEWKKHA